MTVLDLMLLLSNFPPDAKVKLLAQMPGSETIAVRVELADPFRQGHHTRPDWLDEEITDVDPARSRSRH